MSDNRPLVPGLPSFPLKKVFNAFVESLIVIGVVTLVATLLALWGYPTAAKTIGYPLVVSLAVFNFLTGLLLCFKLIRSAPAFLGALARVVKEKLGTR